MSLRRLAIMALLLAAGVSACKDAPGPEPDEPGPPTDIAGTWTYFEQVGNTQLQITCQDQGTIAIAQNGPDLTGTVGQTGQCDGPGGSADNSGTGPFTGNVGAATVRLDFGGCRYRGDLYNTPRDSATGTVSCSVNLGLPYGRVSFSGTWLAVKGIEFDPPAVSGALELPSGDTLLVTGETLRISLSASDDRKLAWVGYRLGPPANTGDSVLVLAADYTTTAEVPVPASWQGRSAVTLFARDAFGRSTETAASHFSVLDAVRRPYQTLSLGARAVDLVYDPARDVIYFAEPESTRVAILALSSFTLGAPIAMPVAPGRYGPTGIDIVPGGDTLVAVLADSARIALFDRVAGTVDTSSIAGPDYVSNVRVTSSRKALVFGEGRIEGGYIAFAVWERDLATGTDTRRNDVGIGGNVNALTPIVRSPDQSKVLLLDIGTGCGYVYDAAAGGFSACSQFGFSSFALATATTTADKWLVGNQLVDGSLALLATVPGLGFEALAGIAPDGSVAYRPTPYGYDRIALPSGAVEERVRIAPPVAVTRTTVLPGGRLFLWSDPIGSPPLWATNRATVVTLP